MLTHLSDPVLYVLLCCSGLFWAVLGLGYKIADHHQCRTSAFSRLLFTGAGACSLLVAMLNHTRWTDWRLWALGIGGGILFYLVLLLLMPAYRLGPPSVVWIVVNLGLLVPIFFARILFGEPLYWYVDSVLLGAFVLMLLAFQRGMAQASETTRSTGTLFLFALIGVFLANGLLLTVPKVQAVLFDGKDSYGYLAIFYFSGALFTLVIDLFRRESLKPTAWEWKAGVLSGISGGIGMLLFMTATRLPAAVQYSLNGGVSLLGGVVLTAFIYRERINLMKITGLLLGTLMLIGIAFRKPLVIKLQTIPALNVITGVTSTDHGQTASHKQFE